MQRLLNWNLPKVLVVRCADYRLDGPIKTEFGSGHATFDTIAMPGSIFSALPLHRDADVGMKQRIAWKGIAWLRRFLLIRDIRLLLTKHPIKKIVLCTHEDCAAIQAITGHFADLEEEKRFHAGLHDRAIEFFKEIFPDIIVETRFQSGLSVQAVSEMAATHPFHGQPQASREANPPLAS